MIPVTWLHNLTKDDAAQLAGCLGIHLRGTEDLDQHPKVLKERWKDNEGFMPSEMLKEKDMKLIVREMDQTSSGLGAAGATSCVYYRFLQHYYFISPCVQYHLQFGMMTYFHEEVGSDLAKAP
jgi:hypothetical protein